MHKIIKIYQSSGILELHVFNDFIALNEYNGILKLNPVGLVKVGICDAEYSDVPSETVQVLPECPYVVEVRDGKEPDRT